MVARLLASASGLEEADSNESCGPAFGVLAGDD